MSKDKQLADAKAFIIKAKKIVEALLVEKTKLVESHNAPIMHDLVALLTPTKEIMQDLLNQTKLTDYSYSLKNTCPTVIHL